MSRRPLTVIEADIEVVHLARQTCQEVVAALLAQRLNLLDSGWPSSNAMCEALDQDAARWAAQAEHQRRALADLIAERDRTYQPEGAAS